MFTINKHETCQEEYGENPSTSQSVLLVEATASSLASRQVLHIAHAWRAAGKHLRGVFNGESFWPTRLWGLGL